MHLKWIISALFLLMAIAAYPQADCDDILWITPDVNNRTIGTGDILTDDDGNIYLATRYRQVLNLDGLNIQPNQGDLLIVKLSPDGHLIWYKSYPANVFYGAEHHIKDGFLYVGYNFIWIDFLDGNGPIGLEDNFRKSAMMKFDLDGNLKWKQVIYGDNLFSDIKADSQGNIYVTCSCELTVLNGDTLSNLEFETRAGIFKFDPDGNYLWHNLSNVGPIGGYPYAGDPLFIDELDNPWLIGGAFNVSEVYFDNLNYLETVSQAGWIAKFDPLTGDNLILNSTGVYSDVFVTDSYGFYYLQTEDGSLSKISSTGEEIWKIPFEGFIYTMYLDENEGEILTGGEAPLADSVVFNDQTVYGWTDFRRLWVATTDISTGSTKHVQELTPEANRFENLVRRDSIIYIRSYRSPWVVAQKMNSDYTNEIYHVVADQTQIYPDDSIYLHIESENSLANKTLQWYVDGFALSGFTDDSLLVVGKFEDVSRSYQVYITDSFGCLTKSLDLNVTSSSSNIPPPNEDILGQFYNEANGGWWINETNWFPDYSSAFGVTFENIDGTDQITKIELPDNNLYWFFTWNVDLSVLPHLRKLDLSGNLIQSADFLGRFSGIHQSLDSVDVSDLKAYSELRVENKLNTDIAFLDVRNNYMTFSYLETLKNFENLWYYPQRDTVVHIVHEIGVGENLILVDAALYALGEFTTFSWFKDGVPLSSEDRDLQLTDVAAEDFGEYLQISTNPLFPLLTYYTYHIVNDLDAPTISIPEGKLWQAELQEGNRPFDQFAGMPDYTDNITISKISDSHYSSNSTYYNWDIFIDGDSIVVNDRFSPGAGARTTPEFGYGKGYIEGGIIYIPWFSRQQKWQDTTRFTFYDDTPAPVTPILSINTEDEIPELTWDHDELFVESFDVEVSEDAGPFTLYESTMNLNLPLFNLQQATTYDFRVIAVGANGSATSNTVSLTTKQAQTVQISAITDQDLDNVLVELDGSADSGLPVSYALVTGKAQIVNGNQIMKLGAGIVTVRVGQAGNADYEPATVTTTFEIRQTLQTITFDPIPSVTYLDMKFALSATGGLSKLPVTYAVTSGDAVIINGDSAIIVGTGNVTITASQTGNFDFLPAVNANQPICISAGSPEIQANGHTKFCDKEVELEAEEIAGVEYNWQLDGADISGANARLFTASEYGIYTLKFTTACGATFSSNSIDVEVGNIPVPQLIASSGSTVICQGDSVRLFVVDEPDVQYQWFKDDVEVGVDTLEFYAKDEGEYFLTFNNSCGSSISTNSYNIEVFVNPESPNVEIDGKLEICRFESTVLTVPFVEDITYEWFQNGVLLDFEFGNALEVTDSGYYHVELFNLCNRVASLDTVRINLSPQAPEQPTISVTGNTKACFGSRATLSIPEQAGVSFAWYRNDTTLVGLNSTEFIATEGGDYHIEVSNDCRTVLSTNMIFVDITFPPKRKTITGDRSSLLCEGDSITLSVPEELKTDYMWFKDGQLLDSGNYQVKVARTGEYYVEMFNDCGSVVSENVFEVNVVSPFEKPDISAYTDIICAGDFLSMQTDSLVFADYKWYVNGSLINANQSIIIAQDSGTYKLILENVCYTSEPSDPFRLEFYPPPPKPAVSFFVNNDCTNLEYRLDAEEGYIAYQWYFEDVTLGGADQTSYEPQLNGVYTVGAWDANGCFIESDPVTVEIADPLRPVISALGDPDSLLVTDLADKYQWFVDNIYIVGATEREYEVIYNGEYRVSIINEEGCIGFSEPYLVSEDDYEDFAGFAIYVSDSSIILTPQKAELDIEFEGMIVYPNPATTFVKVVYKESLDPDTWVRLMDANGKLVSEIRMVRNGDKMEAEMEISTYHPGIYLIVVDNKYHPLYQRVVIKR